MSFRVSVPIPKDESDYLGRECPAESCEGYFKVKPGTGLTGEDLLCHCPYCGHAEPSDRFWTKEQIAYAKSVALRRLTDEFRQELKRLEFDYPPRGTFGIGVSLKVKPGRPTPIRHYREKALETYVTCNACTLEYAIYGVFAYCPDCGTHNSHQILEKNLDLVRKQIALVETIEDDELRRHLLEDALENCVSAFDGFGRESCRVRATKSARPAECENLSFQKLPRAAKRLSHLFGVDLRAAVDPISWEAACRAFMKRHLIAHRSGVVDHQYLDETQDPTAIVGRRVPLDPLEVARVADAVRQIGRVLVDLLPVPVAS